MTIKVEDIKQVDSVKSIDNKHSLEIHHTYLSVVDILNGENVIDIALTMDLNRINQILSVFNFPSIIIDESIGYEKEIAHLKEVVSNQKIYISELEQKIINNNLCSIKKAMKAYNR